MFNPFWNYRGFIAASVKREFHSQYSKSILGMLWIVLNPLYMCILYTSIFSSVMNSSGNQNAYTIYVASGLLAWNFFIDILNRSQQIYLDYANLIKKQNFPLICLPAVVFVLAMIDFLISFGLFTLYLLMIQQFPGWCYLSLFPVLILQSAYALTLGTFLGLCNIFFRDTGRALVIFLQIWFWLTPIVYYVDKLPDQMQYLLKFNPLTAIMSAYQSILVQHHSPAWGGLWFPLVVTVFIMGFFALFYRRHRVEILDEL